MWPFRGRDKTLVDGAVVRLRGRIRAIEPLLRSPLTGTLRCVSL
jgi:hypothetical protein